MPVETWTFEKRGSTQVEIIALDDKRQITCLLTSCLDGSLLPPQLIYAGKTILCHPKYNFPPGWLISHSESHWSTDETMQEYLNLLLIPGIERIRKENGYRKNQPALLLFDVFKCHQSQAFLDKLQRNYIKPIFIPASCTDYLQPNDLSVNKPFKVELKNLFTQWYARQVQKFLQTNGSGNKLPQTASNSSSSSSSVSSSFTNAPPPPSNASSSPSLTGKENDEKPILDTLHVNLTLSFIKPIHSSWVVQAFNSLEQDWEKTIISGWIQSGIFDVVPLKKRRGRTVIQNKV